MQSAAEVQKNPLYIQHDQAITRATEMLYWTKVWFVASRALTALFFCATMATIATWHVSTLPPAHHAAILISATIVTLIFMLVSHSTSQDPDMAKGELGRKFRELFQAENTTASEWKLQLFAKWKEYCKTSNLGVLYATPFQMNEVYVGASFTSFLCWLLETQAKKLQKAEQKQIEALIQESDKAKDAVLPEDPNVESVGGLRSISLLGQAWMTLEAIPLNVANRNEGWAEFLSNIKKPQKKAIWKGADILRIINSCPVIEKIDIATTRPDYPLYQRIVAKIPARKLLKAPARTDYKKYYPLSYNSFIDRALNPKV